MSFPDKEFGLTIEGPRQEGRKHTDQEPIQVLRALVREVLDLDFIHDFGWEQYTPYFNDGDVCEFGLGTVWFRTTADVKRKDVPTELKKLYDDGHVTQEEFEAITKRLPEVGDDEEFHHWDYELYSHPSLKKGSSAYIQCAALAQALEGGSFFDALEETFGDHVKVRITKSKIITEEYQHD